MKHNLNIADKTYSFEYLYTKEVSGEFLNPLQLNIKNILILNVPPDYAGKIKVYRKNEENFVAINSGEPYTYGIGHNLGNVELSYSYPYVGKIEDIVRITIEIKYSNSDLNTPDAIAYSTKLNVQFDLEE